MTIAQSGRSDKFFPAEITAVSFDRAALLRYKLYENGFHPVPVIGKKPVARWPEKFDDEEIHRMAETRATSTGIDAKSTPAIDINIWDGPAAKAVEDLAREFFGEHGNIYVRFGFPPKCDGVNPTLTHRRLILLRTDEPFKKLYRAFIAPNDHEYTIEILGDGEQYVVDGNVDGVIADPPLLYRWVGGELQNIKREDLPYVRREDMERFVDAAAKLLIEKFNFVQKTAEVELEWLRRFVAKAQAEVAKRRAAEPTPKTLQEIREVILELKKSAPEIDFTVDDIIRVLDKYHLSLIVDWRGPFVDGARPRLRQTIGAICAEFGIGNEIPADTLAALKDPSKDDFRQRFWSIMMVLKSKGCTIDGCVALFEKYPKGIAARYRGRLQHEVERTFGKIRIEEPTTPEPSSVKQPHEMAALRTIAFNPIKYVVPSVIVEGLTVLAGKPKIGKSWMMLHAAIAVANGGFTLGDIHCIQGDVLYCALEDNQRRLKSRGEKLLGSAQAWPKRMQYLCLGEMSRLNEGGLDMLKKWISSVPNPRLIVIDTFVAVRAPKKGNQPNFDADYESGKELQKLANEHGIAIVIICHLRKADADDPFDTVNATLGLTAVVDSILILKRETNGFSLHGRGRDLPEIEKAITFDRDTCIWHITGDAAAVRQSTQRAAILNVLEQATEPITPNDIAAETNMKPNNIKFLLRKMVQDGVVEKIGYGKYRAKEISDPRNEP